MLNTYVFANCTRLPSAAICQDWPLKNLKLMSQGSKFLDLALGQGGNQLASSFFTSLASLSCLDTESEDFFRVGANGDRVARAVLIDMEPKVIAAAIKRASGSTQKDTSSWKYDPNRQLTRDSGSGNNWARGFHVHGPSCRSSILDLIRLEVEACDTFGGFLTMQSLAGGTGAGLGAYLMEALRDEYPSACMLSHCIWPYESGEVIVQNYNVLLTLSQLENIVDGIIISPNDSLSSICKKTLDIQRPSFDDLNEVAASALASILLPASWRPVETNEKDGIPYQSSGHVSQISTNNNFDNNDTLRAGSRVRLLSDLVSKLCAHPAYRLLSLRFTPQVRAQSLNFTTFTWAAQIKQLRQMLITGVSADIDMDWGMSLPSDQAHTLNGSSSYRSPRPFNKSLANVLALRGNGSQFANVNLFAHESLYPIWSVDGLSVATNPTRLGKYEMAAGLLSNCQSTVLPASRVLSRAYGMFASRAYLHQYYEHGLEVSAFHAAFAVVEDLVARYVTL